MRVTRSRWAALLAAATVIAILGQAASAALSGVTDGGSASGYGSMPFKGSVRVHLSADHAVTLVFNEAVRGAGSGYRNRRVESVNASSVDRVFSGYEYVSVDIQAYQVPLGAVDWRLTLTGPVEETRRPYEVHGFLSGYITMLA
jgi:hypothetical protein